MAHLTPHLPAVAERAAADLELDLRAGVRLTVLDVRTAEDLAAWRLAPGRARVVHADGRDVERDPVGVAASLGLHQGPVDVICHRGNASRRAAAALIAAGVEATSVRGGLVAWSGLLVTDDAGSGTRARVLQLRREARGCLSYLLASGGHAIVVDPAPDPTPYLSLAASLGVEITQVVETHVHADHVSGARALVARTGAALRLSPAALARGLRDAGQVVPLGDGQPVPLPGSHVRALALPGHTTESMGLLVEGRALLGGDSLFADAVARPDLEAGGRGAEHAARRLHRTLHGRILPLGDAVQLLPAHYPGGRRAGPVAPTLGEVRARLDLLELDEDAFVTRVLSSLPAPPENHERIVAVNLGLADAEAGVLEVGTNGCAVA